MRLLALLIAGAAVSAETPPPTQLHAYEQALTAFHFDEARTIVDRLVRERVLSKGPGRPDALLNAMIGRLYVAVGQPDEATIYLDRAPLAELPDVMRAATALDHGRALELHGDRSGARAAYSEAAAASQNDTDRRRAMLGVARQLLPQDPAMSRDQLLPIATGAPEPQRWEARYLLASSSSLLGDSASARRWADEAWADALAGPPADLAPLRVETLRAGLAAAAHDQATERAMLIASNGIALTASPRLAAQLPVCGDAGVQPSDFVTFGFIGGPLLQRELIPVAASRPGVVTAFADALSGTSPIQQDDGRTPLGTVFTVRCRTVINPYFLSKQPAANPLAEWGVGRGLYFASLFNESDDEHLKPVEEWIDTLAARFGKDSPLLILPRWQVLSMLEARATAGDTVLPGQLADLRRDVAAGLRRAGAPDWLAQNMEVPTPVEVLSQAAGNSSELATQMQMFFRKQLLSMPFDLARTNLLEGLVNLHGEWPAPVSQLVIDLNAKTPPSLVGRERQAWEISVAGAQRSLGKAAEARATILAAGLPNDLCAAADSDLSLLEEHFSYSDYPQELISGAQEGAVLFEFGISAKGTPQNPRILYSLPAGLFDQVSAKGIEALRYTIPKHSGAPVPCRGITQPVVWKLDDATKSSVPVMAPQTLGPTT
jgi:hypothetical protein